MKPRHSTGASAFQSNFVHASDQPITLPMSFPGLFLMTKMLFNRSARISLELPMSRIAVCCYAEYVPCPALRVAAHRWVRVQVWSS